MAWQYHGYMIKAVDCKSQVFIRGIATPSVGTSFPR